MNFEFNTRQLIYIHAPAILKAAFKAATGLSGLALVMASK